MRMDRSSWTSIRWNASLASNSELSPRRASKLFHEIWSASSFFYTLYMVDTLTTAVHSDTLLMSGRKHESRYESAPGTMCHSVISAAFAPGTQ